MTHRLSDTDARAGHGATLSTAAAQTLSFASTSPVVTADSGAKAAAKPRLDAEA